MQLTSVLTLTSVGLYIFFWVGTTCIVAVDLARRFTTRTLYLSLIALSVLLGFTWNSNSPAQCALGLCAICFILPAIRLWLHIACKAEGYELQGKGYKLLVYASSFPGCVVIALFTLIFISLLFSTIRR